MKNIPIKYVLLSSLALLFLWPGRTSSRPGFQEAAPEVYIFHAQDGKALAVVTSDPESAPEDGPRAWRAELHVRIGDRSIVHEVSFRSLAVDRNTVTFEDTDRGYEVQIMEQDEPAGGMSCGPRRFRFRRHEIRELGTGGAVHWI